MVTCHYLMSLRKKNVLKDCISKLLTGMLVISSWRYVFHESVSDGGVKSDVSAAANACRRFFTIEVESRIIAATMSVLRIEKLDDEEFPLPINEMSTKDEKKHSYKKQLPLLLISSLLTNKEMRRY